ncbi:MAG: hypothetical protein ACYC99_08925 [Candidatus Geothermincolia bacterium]
MTSEEAREALEISFGLNQIIDDLIAALAEVPVLGASGSRRVEKSIDRLLRRALRHANEMVGAGTPQELAKPAPATPVASTKARSRCDSCKIDCSTLEWCPQ